MYFIANKRLDYSHDRRCAGKSVIDNDGIFRLLELDGLNIRSAQVVSPKRENERKNEGTNESVQPFWRRDSYRILHHRHLSILLAHQKTFPIGNPVVPSTSGKSDPKSGIA